ncbi:hypothetical protein GIB67_009870 [Kingdonia uniflora]|uniref:Exonuclease domain-containing protein n=1 Tax=Kingdonia uniflora TaxID=39325 RepID=A0A7J7L7R4_9MAGN|nr:hypothetical protein GIB67_009870 [Kingdonia uniflora]
MEAGKLMTGALLGKVNGMEVELTLGLVNKEGTLKMSLVECDCNVNDISITLVGKASWISSDKIGATIYLDMTIDVLDDNRILQVACISVISINLAYQEFQYFVVIDFEATCDKGKNPHPQEIIEVPFVLVNSVNGQIEAFFQTYVRPTFHQHLTDFCKELTSIHQIQADRGVSLSEALLMHDKWLEDKDIKNTNFAVVTWSNWDCRIMLESRVPLQED